MWHPLALFLVSTILTTLASPAHQPSITTLLTDVPKDPLQAFEFYAKLVKEKLTENSMAGTESGIVVGTAFAHMGESCLTDDIPCDVSTAWQLTTSGSDSTSSLSDDDVIAQLKPQTPLTASLAAARLYLDRAAALGNPRAQFVLGVLHSSGIAGFSRDEVMATLYLQFAAFQGEVRAQMTMAFRAAYGVSATKSCHAAVAYYNKVAEKVVTLAQGDVRMPLVERVRLGDDGDTRSRLGDDSELVQYYEFNANKGDRQAQAALGQIYFYGLQGVDQNYERARELLDLAAAQDDAASLALLGQIYASGLGVEGNNATAYSYFSRGASQGNPKALAGLGTLYLHGRGVIQDYRRAFDNFKKGADGNDPDAQYSLGTMYLNGFGTTKDLPKAMHLFTAAMQQGHTVALYSLAVMHLNGIGTPRSCHMATQLFKNVAERGPWSRALSEAYKKYMKGYSLSSLLLYMMLGSQGYEVAQHNTAWLLEKEVVLSGEGDGGGGILDPHVTYDKGIDRLKKSLQWYKLAAKQGNIRAHLKIGDACYYGLGTEVSLALASAHYRAAGDNRNAQAMFNLGYMHEWGLGIPQDFHLAKRYFDMAAEASKDALVPVTMALGGLRLHTWLTLSASPLVTTLVTKMLDNPATLLSDVVDWVTADAHSTHSLGELERDIVLLAIMCTLLTLLLIVLYCIRR